VRRREVLLAFLVACGAYAACTAPPAGDAEPAVDTAVIASAPASSYADSTTSPRRVGCVRSGFTPAELRAALGEPDSIAGGWWIYGRTQIQLSYGTVQDWIDSDSVVVC
jgi:hypothetical protein